jgi:hypothetical protein
MLTNRLTTGASRFLKLLSTGGLVVSCAAPPTEQEVRDEFAAFVATRNHCDSQDDCVLVETGCPLPCHAAVNGHYRNEVEAKARELIEEWNDGTRSCDYLCPSAVAVCSGTGRCEALPL